MICAVNNLSYDSSTEECFLVDKIKASVNKNLDNFAH